MVNLESLLRKGRTFTTNRGKANAFMKEYAVVNRLRFNKEERNRTRPVKSTLKPPTAGLPCGKNVGENTPQRTLLPGGNPGLAVH